MNFFRRLVKSKIGGYIALGFLLLMGFAFAAGDITGSGGLNVLGPSSGTVAEVAGQDITVNELQTRTQRIFERVRQDQPEMTMPRFLAQGGLTQVLNEMIAVKALIAYGERHGMRVSKKLVDAEIARTPAFADAAGNFNESQFRQMLQQQRVSEAELREDFAGQIIRQHLLMAAGAGARTPDALVPRYAAMLLEQRSGEMLGIPSQAYAPKTPPSEAQLKAYYDSHRDDFTIPEQRKLRYVLIDRSRFDAQATPTDAEIAAAYKAREKEFAARQARTLSQLILPTEAQAKDIAAKAAGGAPLATLAREAGLEAIKIADVDQAALAGQTSEEIAKAAFAAQEGKVVGPFRSPLGWTLLHVENVTTTAARPLAEVRDELATTIRNEKSLQLFADFVNDIDGKLGDGETLAEVAKESNLEIKETPFLTGQGRALRDVGYMPDAAVSALLQPAFAMSPDDDPQVVQVAPDNQAAVVAPGEAIAAGPPPLAEVSNSVAQAWMLDQGATKAREAANKINAALNKGVSVDEAIKQAGAVNVQREPVAIRRIDIQQQQQQQGRVSPALETLFAMRTGTAKVVTMENNLGFLVVRLDKITEEDPSSNQQLLSSTRAGLANVMGAEYAEQLVKAIEKDLSVRRNANAIAQVEKALRDANGAAQ